MLKSKSRPDVRVNNEASTHVDVVAELMKMVLVSVRVMEKDESLLEYSAITALPKFKGGVSNEEQQEQLRQVLAEVQTSHSSFLFQPNFRRSFELLVKPGAEAGGDDASHNMLVLAVATYRLKPASTDEILEDIEDYVPTVDEAMTNNLESFPFPTMFDFINEINRPVDALTMSQLTSNFRLKDFKYDLKKMGKKKNPTDTLNLINCKLTRLAKWRDVLERDTGGMPDPFTETVDWSDKVKIKYASLKKAVKEDTQAALLTQYDKRATFIKLIDVWSDRLKRAFKFAYFKGRREPEDFLKPIMESKWRNEIVNSSLLLARTPFLDLQGPDFVPGSPMPMYKDDRYVIYDNGYSVPLVMMEMLSWLSHIEAVKATASIAPLGSIIQHTYSRGHITERVMYDAWIGLSQWAEALRGTPATGEECLSAVNLLQSSIRVAKEESVDHTGDFLTFLQELNSFTREKSSGEHKSVKDFYKTYFESAKDMAEWWTTLIRDADLVHDLGKIAEERKQPWSNIMNDIVTNEANKESAEFTEGIDAAAAALEAEKNAKLWSERFHTTMTMAEAVESLLSWKQTEAVGAISDDTLVQLEAKTSLFKNETVSLSFAPPHNTGPPSFLFVAPRYFRGIGMEEELSAFLEFSQIISSQLRNSNFLGNCFDISTKYLDVVPLHPQMILLDGSNLPDFSRRSPHPALLISIRDANV